MPERPARRDALKAKDAELARLRAELQRHQRPQPAAEAAAPGPAEKADEDDEPTVEDLMHIVRTSEGLLGTDHALVAELHTKVEELRAKRLESKPVHLRIRDLEAKRQRKMQQLRNQAQAVEELRKTLVTALGKLEVAQDLHAIREREVAELDGHLLQLRQRQIQQAGDPPLAPPPDVLGDPARHQALAAALKVVLDLGGPNPHIGELLQRVTAASAQQAAAAQVQGAPAAQAAQQSGPVPGSPGAPPPAGPGAGAPGPTQLDAPTQEDATMGVGDLDKELQERIEAVLEAAGYRAAPREAEAANSEASREDLKRGMANLVASIKRPRQTPSQG